MLPVSGNWIEATPNGSTVRTVFRGGVYGLDVSPDRKWVIFSGKFEDSGYGIYAVRADGTHRTKLVESDDFFPLGNVAISPNGRLCAFTWEESLSTSIKIMDLRTGDVRTLISGSGIAGQIGLDWDPSGRYLAYVDGQSIRLVTMEGVVTDLEADGGFPTFTPLGNRILFVADFWKDGLGSPNYLRFVDVQSHQITTIATLTDIYLPQMDPNGNYIYYYHSVPDGNDSRYELARRSVSGGSTEVLTWVDLTSGPFIMAIVP